mgnify:CR=1 FL=1
MSVNTWNEPLNTWNTASNPPVIVGAFSAAGSVTLPQPTINGNITLPLLNFNGVGSVNPPEPIVVGAFTLPVLTIQGFATVTGLEIIIDPLTNINQRYLSNNINYN